jgi:hypothetical protein
VRSPAKLAACRVGLSVEDQRNFAPRGSQMAASRPPARAAAID